MKGIQQLRMEKSKLTEEAKDLIDKNPGSKWTASCQREYDRLMGEIGTVNNQIDEFQAQIATAGGSPYNADGSVNAQAIAAGATFPGAGQVVDASGRTFRALAKNEKLSANVQRDSRENDFSLADFVRASMGLPAPKNVSTGTATVPTYLSADIIDMVRAKTRVIQAGALTIPISGPTNMCKITGDPTVTQHTEAAADIAESEPTFVPVNFDPKTLISLIPLTLEVVADSPNLDTALNMSISAAFGQKLDSLSISTILADDAIPTNAAGSPATGQATDDWSGILAGVGSMLAADQDIPSANICNSADFIARASQQASTAGTWLGAPPILQNMLDLQTTGVDAGTAIMGDFERGFAIAMRQELRVELIRHGKHSTGSHLLIAYLRADGYVLQPDRLYIQKATV